MDPAHFELGWLKQHHNEHLTSLFSRLLILPSLGTDVVCGDNAKCSLDSEEILDEKASMIKSLHKRLLNPTIEERLKAEKEAHGADQVRQTLHELTNREFKGNDISGSKRKHSTMLT